MTATYTAALRKIKYKKAQQEMRNTFTCTNTYKHLEWYYISICLKYVKFYGCILFFARKYAVYYLYNQIFC